MPAYASAQGEPDIVPPSPARPDIDPGRGPDELPSRDPGQPAPDRPDIDPGSTPAEVPPLETGPTI